VCFAFNLHPAAPYVLSRPKRAPRPRANDWNCLVPTASSYGTAIAMLNVGSRLSGSEKRKRPRLKSRTLSRNSLPLNCPVDNISGRGDRVIQAKLYKPSLPLTSE
jgi:hypothetical protein